MTAGRTIDPGPATDSNGKPAHDPAAVSASEATGGASDSVAVLRRQLVDRARSGDREAFEGLVRSNVGPIHRLARAILGQDADAADATQETFLLAWRRLAGLRDPDAFERWLRQIAVNACRQQLRRRARTAMREIAIETEADLDEPAGGGGPDDRAIEAERFDRAFGCLSVEDRAVLVLHHLEARPVAEIAAALGWPQGTVKSRLFRARAALESALAKESR